MRLWRITASHSPVLLLDPRMGRAADLALQLELNGFPTHIEGSTDAAHAAIQHAHFATLIVIANLHDALGLDWLDDLRRAAPRSWMIVASALCDRKTHSLVYRHGGDACITVPVSIDDLTRRLNAFQLRARPFL